MLKYAFIPGNGLEKRPEYSHGSSHDSMCFDVYAAKDATFSKGENTVHYIDSNHIGAARWDDIPSWEVDVQTRVLPFKGGDSYRFPSILPYANVSTGLVFDLPRGVHLGWASRSGGGFGKGRYMFEGKIDSSYRGEIAGLIFSTNPYDDNSGLISAGEKFGQLEILDYRSDLEKTRHMRKYYTTEQLLAIIDEIVYSESNEYELTDFELNSLREASQSVSVLINHPNFKLELSDHDINTMKDMMINFILSTASYHLYTLKEVDLNEIDRETKRGAKGFGSTGK